MTVTDAPDTVADLFRQRRVAAGVTLEQLARRAEVAYSTVVRVENGQRHPRRGTAHAIARVLGVEPGELERFGIGAPATP